MLPSINRLKKDRDFDNIFRRGVKINSQNFYLIFVKNNLDYSRFGFVVSKKVSNKAVVRNKIKRKLRALIRDRLGQIRKGIDVAIIVKPGFNLTRLGELEKNIKEVFNDSKFSL